MHFPRPISLAEAAALLGCAFRGDPAHEILGANEIHKVGSGDLTFVDVEKYYAKALGSEATTVLINKEVEVPVGKGLLISDDPFRDYNKLTETFQPRIPVTTAAEPVLAEGATLGRGAVTGEDVTIGADTEIGHNVVIGSHVTIGSRCIIFPGVYIADYSIIGDDVTVGPNAVIGGEAFYYKARPTGRDKMLTKGRVILADRVDIGAGTTIDRGVSHDTVIGWDTKIDNQVQIGHDTVIGPGCLISAQAGVAGVVVMEKNVTLWAQGGIKQDVVIGAGAKILAKSGVGGNLEGGRTYFGFIAEDHRAKLREMALVRNLPHMEQRLRTLEKQAAGKEDHG
jgi:UDP-3-O-[3-hydroxymyristoyl] glucosamine N-acyltransferase